MKYKFGDKVHFVKRFLRPDRIEKYNAIVLDITWHEGYDKYNIVVKDLFGLYYAKMAEDELIEGWDDASRI